MLTIRTLLVLITSFIGAADSSTDSAFMNNYLGFNLPNSRFCQTCVLNTTTIKYTATEEIYDESCKDYATSLVTKPLQPWLARRRLAYALTSTGTIVSHIYYAYLKAVMSFEIVYKEAYSLQAFIKSDSYDTADNCVQLYTTGDGFFNSSPPLSTELTVYYETGIHYEGLFLQSFMDYWITRRCNKPKHLPIFELAEARQREFLNKAKDFNLKSIVYMGDVGQPNYTTTVDCGEEGIRKHPNSPLQESTCKDMVCASPSKYRRVSDEGGREVSHEKSCPNVPFYESQCDHTSQVASRSIPTMFINEINPAFCDLDNINEFIELRYFPIQQTMSTLSSKVIVVSAITARLLTVVNLYNIQFYPNGYLPIDSNNFPHIASDVENKYNLLPCGKREPMIVALLQKEHTSTEAWKTISLTEKRGSKQQGTLRRSRNLLSPFERKSDGSNINILDVIQQTLQDYYVYGDLVNNKINQKIAKAFSLSLSECNFVLPPANQASENEAGMTLSLCSNEDELRRFDFEHVKLGQPTKGNKNDCRALYYRIDKTEQTSEFSNLVGVTNQPQISTDCPSEDKKVGGIILRIEREINVIRERYNPSYTNPDYPVSSSFADAEIVKNMYGNSESVSDFLPFVKASSSSTLPVTTHAWKCEICSRRLQKCAHTASPHFRKLDLAKPEGKQLPTNWKTASRQLNYHLHSYHHYISILDKIIEDKQTYQANSRNRVLQDGTESQQLANLFDITYTLVKTNTAVQHSKLWYQTLSKINADVGNTRHSPQTAKRIINFLSSEGLSNILNYMISGNKPFSLLLDASSDKRNQHYVLFYIQTTEGEYVIAYYAGLYKLSKTFSSDAYITAIEKFVESKGLLFEQYFYANCVGLITDGAKVMEKLGIDFQALLRRRSGQNERKVLHLLCLSHRLQLITRNSIVPLKTDKDHGTENCLLYLQTVEKITQHTYSWIKHGARRIGEYREVVDEFNLPRVELKELHVERWISSEYITIKTFLKAWVASIKTTERIAADLHHTAKNVREEATRLNNKLLDKTFLITMVYLQDYSSGFQSWSLATQKFASPIIEQSYYYERLVSELQMMEYLQSPVLSSFLKSCKCSSSPSPTEFGCTLENYEQSDLITWRGVDFTTTDENAPLLSVLGPDLIKKTKKLLEKYIPLKLVRSAGALNVKKLPPGYLALKLQHETLSTSLEDIPVYAREEIEYLAELFGISKIQLIPEWATLFMSMTKSNDWESLRQDPESTSFWARALRNDNFPWTPFTKKLIRSVLAIAAGSAIVESGFSMFNIQKNQRRTSMSDELLSDLLNIHINGPDSIDDFDSNRYADRYIQRYGNRILEPSTTETCDEDNEEETEEEVVDRDPFEDIATNEPISDTYEHLKVDAERKPSQPRIRSFLT